MRGVGRWRVEAAMGVLFWLAASGAWSGERATAERPAELADGVLTVIIFPVLDEPFIAPDLDAGMLPWRGGAEHFQGIDIDLMVGFARELEVEVEFIRLREPGFGGLLPALINGRGDMVASAVTITAERDRTVDFSRPYFEVSTVVVAPRIAGVRSLDDLVGKTGVGVRGSRPISLLRKNGFSGPVLEADFQTGAYAEIVDGSADFAIMESASAIAAVAARPTLEIAFSLPAQEGYGLVVQEGSSLLPLVNRYLERMDASGALTAILERHLGGAASTH